MDLHEFSMTDTEVWRVQRIFVATCSVAGTFNLRAGSHYLDFNDN